MQALTFTALNYVSQQRVTLDNSITRLTAASDAVTNEKTQLTVAQTNLMQADLAAVGDAAFSRGTQQTALEAVIVQLGSSNSLFGKLPLRRSLAFAMHFIGWRTIYTASKRIRVAGSSSIYMECNSRPSACAVAQRVSSLAGRDLFR